MRPAHDQLTTFRRLFLPHAPAYQAWMQPAGAAAKYLKKFHPISDVELTAHLAGRLTIAVPLSGADDQAHAAALDIDQGGADALVRVLRAAQRHSLTAFAVTSAHADHCGGHVWLLFAAPVAVARLRCLANDLAQDARVVAETYPSGRMLRLPLGVHRGSGQRGRVLLQDGTVLDLDAGADAIATALTRLDGLPRNGVALLPPAPVRRSRAATETRQDGAGATNAARRTIEAFNAATDLLRLLEGYGGQIAVRHRGDHARVHCPCGQHRNGDAHASLEIQPARSSRYGRSVAVGYAPRCAFSLEQRVVVDAFAVYCYFEQLTVAEALRSLPRTGVGMAAPPARPPSPATAHGMQLALDAAGGRS